MILNSKLSIILQKNEIFISISDVMLWNLKMEISLIWLVKQKLKR